MQNCLPNYIPVHDADWFRCHFWQLYLKLIGQKFTFFLSSPFARFVFLSVMHLLERMNTSKMTQIEKIGIYLYFQMTKYEDSNDGAFVV